MIKVTSPYYKLLYAKMASAAVDKFNVMRDPALMKRMSEHGRRQVMTMLKKFPRYGDKLTIVRCSKDGSRTITKTIWGDGKYDIFVEDADGLVKSIHKRVKGSSVIISTWDVFNLEGKNIAKLFKDTDTYLKRTMNKVKDSSVYRPKEAVAPVGTLEYFVNGKKEVEAVEIKVKTKYINPRVETVAEQDPLRLNEEFVAEFWK